MKTEWKWTGPNWRDQIYQRVPDFCMAPWHMKMAYTDYARRERVWVVWPLNYIVEFAWFLNLKWCQYTHTPSWIDKEVKARALKVSAMNNAQDLYEIMQIERAYQKNYWSELRALIEGKEASTKSTNT